jgi:hypothetical protein
MKRIGRWVALLATVALAACTTAPTTVEHYQMYLPEFPSLLVAHTQAAPPPDLSQYLAANADAREQMWTDAYNAQTTNLWTCNIDKDKVQDWWTKQQAAVAAANGASASVAASAAQVGQ